MSGSENIDDILREWPYDPETVSVRMREGTDGREVIQMRVEMGLLQLETSGRPDGAQPQGAETYYDYLLSLKVHQGDAFLLDDEQCAEIDREFVQYYHRRICWLALRDYRRAIADADHTLELMDFCSKHSDDDQWIMTHEQYRPFVLFHRTQAAALAELEENGPETGVDEIELGLKRLRDFFVAHDAGEHFEEDDLVVRLHELRESMQEKFDVGFKLRKQLEDAVAEEKYELAAELRDQLDRLRNKSH